MPTVKISIIRSDSDSEYIEKYIEGHAEVLRVVGITKVTSSRHEWRYNPDNYVLYVESEDGRALGGGRIQLLTPEQNLPMEGAIIEKDSKVTEVIHRHPHFETAEFCGLWNSKEIAGYGIGSIVLTRIGVSITNQLHINRLFALCSPATLNNSKRVGFQVITALGNNGTFYYPKENLIATAIWLPDPQILSTADESDRKKIFSLREDPFQIGIESGPKGEIQIEYNLKCSR